MKLRPSFSLACFIGAMCFQFGSLLARGPLAIQDATIITISGKTIEKGNVLVRDGKIVAVGAEVEIPGEARVIDGEGMVVMPGIVDAHNASGMSQANEQNSVVPFLSVVDSIDPVATYFEECRRNGITTAAVVPGNSTLIGGKAAIVKTAGQYVNEMVLRRDSAVKLSLRPTSGSRMTQISRLRKELDKAKKSLEKESEKKDDSKDQEEEKKDEGKKDGDKDEKSGEKEDQGDGEKKESSGESKPSAEDEGLSVLKLIVQGKMPVYIYCERAMDVAAAKKLAEAYNLDAIYVLGRGCHKAASMLAELDETVILDPTLVYWETDPRTRQDKKVVLPKIYNDAGVPYIFQVENSSSRTTLGNSYYWYQAATAIKYGLDREAALAALTLEPAKLLGIDEIVGSIEPGKDADLMVLTGDPLEITSWVQYTIVAGEVVYDRSEDDKLERLLAPTAE